MIYRPRIVPRYLESRGQLSGKATPILSCLSSLMIECGYGRLIGSESRSRIHPEQLQKIYEGAHLRQAQSVARGRPLIGLEHNLKAFVGEKIRPQHPAHRQKLGSRAQAGRPASLARRACAGTAVRRRQRAMRIRWRSLLSRKMGYRDSARLTHEEFAHRFFAHLVPGETLKMP